MDNSADATGIITVTGLLTELEMKNLYTATKNSYPKLICWSLKTSPNYEECWENVKKKELVSTSNTRARLSHFFSGKNVN